MFSYVFVAVFVPVPSPFSAFDPVVAGFEPLTVSIAFSVIQSDVE
jgi:hypothetical protein